MFLLTVNAPESSPSPPPPTQSPIHPLDRELNFANTVTVFQPTDASRDDEDEQVRVCGVDENERVRVCGADEDEQVRVCSVDENEQVRAACDNNVKHVFASWWRR